MHILKRTVPLFSASILLVVSAPVSNAQQLANGNCNAQLQGSGNDVHITCVLASSFGGGFPDSGEVQVNLQASVSGLQRGSNGFTLWLKNNTPNQTLDVPTRLSISDNLGNVYELDRFAMRGGLVHTIPPNGVIQLNYALINPISQNASSVTFTLDDIWTQPTGSRFSDPVPLVQWETRLS